jgi:GDP-L-fucose synthase
MFNVNVLEASRLNKVQKLVYTSSIGAYANGEVFKEGEPGDFHDAPMDFAGWAKRMAELQVHAYRVQYGMESYAIVRPSNVYGPGDNFDPENAMVVPSLMHRVHSKEDPVVVWGDGSAIRDIVYSRDVAEGVMLALHHGTKGKYVNLGAGRGYSIRELVETLGCVVPFNYRFDATKPSGFPKRVMDIALARQLIDYNPSKSLAEGLKAAWDWYVANRDEYKKKKNYFVA